MRRARERATDLPARVAEHLRRHGSASSHALAERFLKLAVPSEEAATRILRGALEPHGLVYEVGIGWSAAASTPGIPCLVAVAFDDAGGAPVLIEVRGDAAGDPSTPGEVSLEGATAVLLEPRRDGERLAGLLRRKHLAMPAGSVSLRSAVRGGPRIPRRAGLEEICAILGVRWHDGGDAAATALAMARCLARSSAWRQAPVPEDADPVPDLPGAITAEALDALPETPGIYRFLDAEGALLYVGKARNLRRRVRSYFARRIGGGHGSRFVARIHTVEHETLGSELEALLKEARLIRSQRPSANVQLTVHERGRTYGKARGQAILIPGASGGVTVVFLVDGRHSGHVPIGPRGGGLEKAHRLLRRVMRGPGRAGARHDADTEILASWLARHGESVSRIDLDAFRDVESALHALERAVKDLRGESEAVVFR